LVLLYVGLELTTFPLVLLTAFARQDSKSSEGALKYLLLAALGSALLLFGFSLLFIVAKETQLPGLARTLVSTPSPLALGALLCILAGLGFKISVFPFQWWAPDAYEGAPTAVTAFLSVASKTAGFALILRILLEGLTHYQQHWGMLLAIISAGTMFLGNLAAIPQTNIKRMLAYSSIAQAGYILMGVAAAPGLGKSALLFYLAAYAVTNLGAFAVVMAVEHFTGSTQISAYSGLAVRSPRLGLMMLLSLLSLAGIPPLAGFTAKFYIFAAAYGQGFVWLVWCAVINSALSLYYYLRVVRVMYILPPENPAPFQRHLPWPLIAVMVFCLLGMLALGIYPAPVVNLAQAALN
jgi:NADH-quinone oxidoreductase subunit N